VHQLKQGVGAYARRSTCSGSLNEFLIGSGPYASRDIAVLQFLRPPGAGGRNAGMVAGLVAIWLTAVIRKVVTGSVPSLLTITAIELTVQAAVVLATGAPLLPGGNLAVGGNLPAAHRRPGGPDGHRAGQDVPDALDSL
jgi:hypothetical protein